jgi:hypothetical protein
MRRPVSIVAAEALQVRRERHRDRARSALRDRPVFDVRGHREQEAERGRERLRERQHGVPRAAREQRASALAAEEQPSEPVRGEDRAQTEAQHADRVRGDLQRRHHVGEQVVRAVQERTHEARINAGRPRRARRRCARASG